MYEFIAKKKKCTHIIEGIKIIDRDLQQSPSLSKDGTQIISVRGSVFQPIAVILLPMSREAFSALILIPWPTPRSQSQCWNQHPKALPYAALHCTEPASKL